MQPFDTSNTFPDRQPKKPTTSLRFKKRGKQKKGSRIIPHQTLAWIDIGQLDFFQTSRLAHQGVRGGSHGLITDGVQNL